MLKNGFIHAALTAAALATFLSAETDKVSAHHGWSEYNNKQTLNLTGEIQNVSYGNPHATIAVKTADKKVWRVILAPPSRMQRRGLPQGALQAGQQVRLVGYLHRSESNEIRAEQIIIGDRTVELR